MVYVNGIVEYVVMLGELFVVVVLKMWFGCCSVIKVIDFGMFDNVVVGGIGWGLGVYEMFVKECWEEVGILVDLVVCVIVGCMV